MGKKKGRQTRDFKSKAERGGFRQAISHAAETARAEERAAAEYSRRETAAAHARPRLKAGTLSSLRDFLSTRRNVVADPTDATSTRPAARTISR